MSRRYREWNLDCKVYVGNLHESTSKAELENTLAKYGPLKNVWIARNPPGFAFVEYEDSRDADDAVRALDGTRINGSRVRVEKSHGRQRRGAPRRGGGGRDRGFSPRRRFDRHAGERYRRSRSRSRSPAQRARRYSKSRSRSRSRSRSQSRNSIPRTPRSPPSRSPAYNGSGAVTPPSRGRSHSSSPQH